MRPRSNLRIAGAIHRRGEPGGTSFVLLRERRERTLAEWDERQLIARLRTRDLEALAEVFRRYGDAMTTLACSMLRDRSEADDVVEDALLRIHGAGPGFRGERGLRTWVLRIAANLCRDRLRRRKFDAGPVEDLEHVPGMSFDPVADWDIALDQRSVAAALERAIEALPAEQRKTIVLRHRLGLSYAEIVETLGIPEGTVKSRLARALDALRDAMKEQGS